MMIKNRIQTHDNDFLFPVQDEEDDQDTSSSHLHTRTQTAEGEKSHWNAAFRHSLVTTNLSEVLEQKPKNGEIVGRKAIGYKS